MTLKLSGIHLKIMIKNCVELTQLATNHANKHMQVAIHMQGLACVAWRFCRAGRTSGEAAEIRARSARERAAKPREK